MEKTWQKTINKQLYAMAGQSIEVDPVDPDSVFIIMWHSWDKLNPQTDGLYHSDDGGYSWKQLISVPTQNSRWNEHNIAYDKAINSN